MRSGAAAQKEGVWMEGSYLIKCEHLDLGYENQDAVVDVNMEVDPGDYLCIVGENGSGKSTPHQGTSGTFKAHGRQAFGG